VQIRGMAFVADKVLRSGRQNFKNMVESYIHTDVAYREKLEEFTYGSKMVAIQHRMLEEAQKK
jgi:hypothetical protein